MGRANSQTIALTVMCAAATVAVLLAPPSWPQAANASASDHYEHLDFRGSAADVALWDAAVNADLDGVQAALKAGADPNATSTTARQATALSLAAMGEVSGGVSKQIGAFEVAEALFAAGATLQPADHDILYSPIDVGNLELVQLLVEHGASPVAEEEGFTPTELARKYDQPAVYDYLVSVGGVPVDSASSAQLAFIKAAEYSDIPGMQLAFTNGARVDVDGPDGMTALVAALRSGDLLPNSAETVDWLLDHDANPNAKGESGFNDLEGIPLDIFVFMSGPGDNGPVPVLVQERQSKTLARLLAAGAKVSSIDSKGRTPLHWAAKVDNVAAAQMLIRAGARVMARDLAGRTPLDYAESASMIALLKANGATER